MAGSRVTRSSNNSRSSSPFPRPQQAFHDVGAHPIFRDPPVAKSADDHVAPDHAPAGCRKTSEAAVVRPLESPLPGHPVFRLQQDFNFDLELREPLLKFAHELPDRTVSLDLLIGTVSDIVRR